MIKTMRNDNAKTQHKAKMQGNTKNHRSRDGTVVRALTSHLCGLEWIPGLDTICGLSLLLVLFSTLKDFSPSTPKPNTTLNINPHILTLVLSSKFVVWVLHQHLYLIY